MVQRIIREERFKSFVMTFVYLLALGCGIAAAAHPPSTIEGAVTGGSNSAHALPYLWATLLILAGLFGLGGIGGAALWAERIALRAGSAGLAFYAVIVASLHTQTDGNRLPQLFAIALAATAIWLRWPDVRSANYSWRAMKRRGARGNA